MARPASRSSLGGRGFAAVLVALAGALTVQACTDRNVVAVEIGAITIQPGTASLLEGERLQFRAVVTDVGGRALPRATVVWSSASPALLSIDAEGMAEALVAGSVEVTATFRGVSGTATVTVIAAPAIELRRDTVVITTADSVVFMGGAAAQSPAAQVFQVRNGGGGTLGNLTAEVVYGAGQPEGWLTPVLAGAEAPTTMTLTPQTATLPVGMYDATISLTSPDDDDSPVFLPISLSLMDFTVSESDGGTSVTEAGSTDDFTVVLDAAPTVDVVIDVSSADSTEVRAAPAQLTFTSLNWDQPQTVTLTGQDESVSDGDRQTDVTLAVADSTSDDAYDPVPDKAVAATVIDDDLAAYTVAESGGGTAVTEAAAADDFTVVLDVQPLTPVVFDVTSDDPSEATAAPATLTFDASNWDSPQTVTVTGVDDDIIDGTQSTSVTVSVNGASSDDAFDGLDADTVTVTTTDDDSAGFTVAETDGSSQVNEIGTTDDLTVVLDAQPGSNVVVTLTNPSPAEVGLSAASLTFTSANWSTAQTVTLTGVNDELFDGDQDTDITIAIDDANSDDGFDALPDTIVTVTTIDDDTPGITVTQSNDTSFVAESGTIDDFAVVLNTQPQPGQVVVLDVTSMDAGEVVAAPATLTFNPTNWLDPQTVTLTGVDERIDDGDQVTPVTVSVSIGASDPDFSSVAPDTVSVTTTDDDTAAFTITETAGGTLVTEAGATDDFTVVLGSQPVDDVVFSVLSLNENEVSVDQATLTFTAADWETPQTVTVTGVDDLLNDGDQFTLVAVSVVGAASDDAYDPVADQSVNVTTTDNDSAAGLTVTVIAGTTVDEAGPLTDDFTAQLETQPASDVVLDITAQDAGEVAVSPLTLTFTTANWDTPQTVAVTGVDDDIIDGDVNSNVIVAVDDANSDDTFDGLTQSLSVTTVDDDVAGLLVVEVGGTSVTEGGSADDFTVALEAEPASDVEVAVTSADTGEATVNPGTLTFTSANWDTPQTVTVTGVDDAEDDDDQTTAVTIAVVDANSDDDFDGLSASVLVMTFDDDGVGLTITEQGSTTVLESGSMDTFTVVLDAQPASNVVLDITSSNTAETTVAPATLTFTPANWDTPQTVTVTGVNDDVADGDQVSTITVAVDDASSDPAYAGVMGQVLATTTDDDNASFVLGAAANTTVTEAGSVDPFTVVLGSEPTSEVVITVTSADIVEATATPGQLTFTPANWDTPQTVTVAGGDDLIDDGDQVTVVTVSINAGSSDDAFDALPAQTVDVTTQDDDTADLTLAGTGGMTVAESGTTADFTVVLDAQPVVNVQIDVTSSDTGEATVSPVTLTFTPVNWSVPQTATVRGVDDSPLDGNQVSLITVAVDDATSDDAFDGLSASFNVTTTDNDVAGFSIEELGGTRVSESGSSDEFTVVLDAQPTANVVIDITSGDLSEATVNPATLIFTPGDWNSTQTVTVTGVDDLLDDDDQLTTVTVAVDNALTTDDLFDNLSSTLQVTTTDDDGVGFTITEIGSTTVPEAGLFSDNFTVVLDAQPATPVVIDVTSTDTGEATVSQPTLTFTGATWNTPQTVTVMGVDDDLIDGNQETDINVVVDDANSDDVFDGLAGTVVATTTDDDVAGFTLVGTAGLAVAETATADDFTVLLDAQPTSPVVLTVTSLDTGEATAAPATLTFTNGNWNTPQTVTLTGVNDALVDGAQVTTIRLQIDQAASDDAFDAVANQTATVTTADDDMSGLVIAPTGPGTTVTEAAGAGNTDTFTIALGAQPNLNVVVTIASGDATEASVLPSAVTFTPANWDTPQTITVTGADDLVDDGDQATVVAVAVDDANSDNAFDGLTAAVNVTTVDDDVASYMLAGTAGLSVNESGTSDQFTIVLGTQPTSNVVLSATTGDPGEVTIGTPLITFTTANWDTPQPVTVVGADDIIDDGDQNTTVTIAVVDASSDDAFDNLGNQTVTVATVDDDDAGFALAGAAALTVSESGTTDDFTVVLTTQPTSNVVLDVTSSDTGEATVGPAALTFTPATWDVAQIVTVTGVDDNPIDTDQVSTITVAVNDAASDDRFDGLSATANVTTTDDDGAGLTVVELGGTTVNEAGSTDNFTVAQTAEPASNVVVNVVSQDTGEATVGPATLTFTPANYATTQTVTVTGVDDAIDDDNQTTTVDITVNDAASDDDFDGLAETIQVTTTDDDGVGFTITELGGTEVSETGTADQFGVTLDSQPGSNVVLDVTSADLGEATVDMATLTFTPGNWNTSQTVSVTGIDDVFVDGVQTTPVTVAVNAALSDNAFDLLAPQTVQATTTDDDVAAYTTTESAGTTVTTEGGAPDDFEVVLLAGPVTPVVLTVTSAATAEATVDLATLTFTPGNWDTPQTVLVTAVNDVFVDGPQMTVVTLAVDDAISDDQFDPLGNQFLNATTNDNDVAGLTVVEPGGGTTATEGGATDDFTVRLAAGPLTDVVVDIATANGGEAMVSPTMLTFTSANWDTPQPVTVTAEDDVFVDGPQTTTLTVSIDDANSNDAFDGVADETVDATTNDNDIPGFMIAETAGTTTVPEAGGPDDVFTVVLNSGPLTPVVLNVTSGDEGEATVDAATLTFTMANWDTPQPVTVSGADDVFVDGSQNTAITVSVDDVNSNDAFDPVADQNVTAQTTDDDVAGFAIVESAGGTTVQEVGGTPDDFTVVLTGGPVTPVILNVASGDLGEATVNMATVTFTPGNWDQPQTVTVTGVDDQFVDGAQATDITISVNDAGSDNAFDPLADETVSATTTDDDVASFTVAQTGPSTISIEGGATDDFTVVLDRGPVGPVMFNVTSGDPGEAAVDVPTLTFTAANWMTPQFVTITAVDDPVVDGPQLTTITVAINDPGSDDAWDALGNQTLSATTNDNDVAGFTMAHTAGNTTVTEAAGAGNTDQMSVVLDAAPVLPVVLDFTSGDTGEATVNPAQRTFTQANWDTPQLFTVTGVDEDIDDGDQTTTITAAVNDAMSDNAWDPLGDETLDATTTDDDVAGFTIAESAGNTTVTEAAGAGNTDDFTVVLDTEPTSNVVFDVASGDLDEATVVPATLTFTPATWDTPQGVTVTGVDDAIIDGDQMTTITVSVDDANSDDLYDPLADQTVTATTTSDDVAGFTVTETAGNTTVTEAAGAGNTDTFDVELTAEPATNVVITVVSGNIDEATVNTADLTFTPANWDTAQPVTVTGIDEDFDDGDQVTAITLAVDDANSDDNWDPLANQAVNTTTVDDDVAGFTIAETAGNTTVTEAPGAGRMDTFTAVLTSEPTSDVVLSVGSGDPGEATAGPATLTFTDLDWDQPQTVTVTAVDDDIIDGTQNTTVTLAVVDAASDDTYDPVADQTVTVATTDDDVAGFTVTEPGGTSVTEAAGAGNTDTFDVELTAEPASNVVITVVSGEIGEATVSMAALTFTPANWDTPQTVTVAGVDEDVDDGDQVTAITLAVDDANSDDDWDPIVNQVVNATTVDDDVAGFTVVETDDDTTVTEAAGAGRTDTFTVVLDSQPTSDVVFTIVSANTGEATVGPATLTFTDANWNTAQPITVTGVDEMIDDGDQVTAITVSVDDANSDDVYDPLGDQVVNATTIDDDPPQD